MPEFDVVDLGPTDHVAEGETAPDFTRPLVSDEFWEDRALSTLDGERVVLVFTTMVGAFPAKYVMTELQDRGVGVDDEGEVVDADGTDGLDATVVAVSISSPYEISPFLDDQQLPYGVFSDPTNEVADTYGVVHDLDGMAGITEPRPAVFVLDADRTVEYAWVATEWPEMPDYDELEAALSER